MHSKSRNLKVKIAIGRRIKLMGKHKSKVINWNSKSKNTLVRLKRLTSNENLIILWIGIWIKRGN